MVSELSLLFMSITLVISLILPVVLNVVYAIAYKGEKTVSAWFLGAAGFVVFQMLVRTPILSAVSTLPGFADFVNNYYVLYAVILGVTAALFEVIGRVCVAIIMSDKLTYHRGVAAGLGHGGIEAMLLIGLTYVTNLLYSTMINNGSYDMIIEQTAVAGMDVTSLYTMKDTLINTPSYLFGLGGFERILTIICHLAMSLVVCYFVAKKQTMKGVVIALVFHTLIDTGSGILSGLNSVYMKEAVSQNTAYVLTYAFLIAMAALAILAIKKIKDRWEYETSE